MINYIIGLKPHNIQSTVSVNTSRMLIFRMSKPLADISQNITDNIERMKDYQKMQESRSLSIDELHENLVIKRIGLKIIALENAMTVCSHEDCVTYYSVDGCSTVKYSQICHDNCKVSGIRHEVIGDFRLYKCKAINATGFCKRERCRHNFRQHMHIYYESEPYEYDAEDTSVSKDIRTNEDAQADINKKMEQTKACIEKYEYEQDVIQDSMAKFAHFLKHNTITPINDAYKDYIQYYINLEKKKGNSDPVKIQYFRQLMMEYDEKVNLLERKLKEERAQNYSISAVSSEDIAELKNLLCKLPLYGHTIKEAIEAQQSTARNNAPIKDVKKIRSEKGKVQKVKEWIRNGMSVFRSDKKSSTDNPKIEARSQVRCSDSPITKSADDTPATEGAYPIKKSTEPYSSATEGESSALVKINGWNQVVDYYRNPVNDEHHVKKSPTYTPKIEARSQVRCSGSPIAKSVDDTLAIESAYPLKKSTEPYYSAIEDEPLTLVNYTKGPVKKTTDGIPANEGPYSVKESTDDELPLDFSGLKRSYSFD